MAKKLLDQLSEALRTKHYCYRTEETYKEWIKRYTLRVFHNKRHPSEMGVSEIQSFLSHLATEKNIAASTQNQALSAILFLYRHVLLVPIDIPTDIIRAEKSRTLPTVLSHLEAMAVIREMKGVPQLMVKILYGSGLRLMECLRLRVKDIDFGNHQIIVRDGKGDDDREGQNFRFQEIGTLELNRRTIRIRTDWLDHEPEKTHQILTAPGHQQMRTLMPVGGEGGPATLALTMNEVHQCWEARMMAITLFNIGFGLSTRPIHRTRSERKIQITL